MNHRNTEHCQKRRLTRAETESPTQQAKQETPESAALPTEALQLIETTTTPSTNDQPSQTPIDKPCTEGMVTGSHPPDRRDHSAKGEAAGSSTGEQAPSRKGHSQANKKLEEESTRPSSANSYSASVTAPAAVASASVAAAGAVASASAAPSTSRTSDVGANTVTRSRKIPSYKHNAGGMLVSTVYQPRFSRRPKSAPARLPGAAPKFRRANNWRVPRRQGGLQSEWNDVDNILQLSEDPDSKDPKFRNFHLLKDRDMPVEYLKEFEVNGCTPLYYAVKNLKEDRVWFCWCAIIIVHAVLDRLCGGGPLPLPQDVHDLCRSLYQ